MKFQFIEREHGTHSVELMVKMFSVSRSGYYGWRSRSASKRAGVEKVLVEEIRKIQEGKIAYRYGSPRITEELRK